jgi:hypothetical protein
MYSPKIRPDLIPRVYRAARSAGLAMTAWVNQAVEQALPAEPTKPEQTETTQRKENVVYEQVRP